MVQSRLRSNWTIPIARTIAIEIVRPIASVNTPGIYLFQYNPLLHDLFT